MKTEWVHARERKSNDTELILKHCKDGKLTDCYVGEDGAMVMVFDSGHVVRLQGGYDREVYTDVMVKQVRYMTLSQAAEEQTEEKGRGF